MKPKRPTLADVQSKVAANPTLAALNPHLFPAPAANATGSPASRGEDSDTSAGRAIPAGKTRRIRVSPKPKTSGEKQMALVLGVQKKVGEIHDFKFEGITLLVGDGLRYNPDFAVTLNDGRLRCIEMKGAHIQRHGLQAFQAAKGSWPSIEFQLWQCVKGTLSQLV